MVILAFCEYGDVYIFGTEVSEKDFCLHYRRYVKRALNYSEDGHRKVLRNVGIYLQYTHCHILRSLQSIRLNSAVPTVLITVLRTLSCTCSTVCKQIINYQYKKNMPHLTMDCLTNYAKNTICILTVPSPMSATSQCSTGVLPICANTMVQLSERKASCDGYIFRGPPGKIVLAFGFRGEALLKAAAAVSLLLDPQRSASLPVPPPSPW